jgi:alkylhydroperoxidase/carboxymuconolactone decarboxylase family protein YurZ
MYAPGTRRHIKGALKAGVTMEEIVEALKLRVVQGSILAEEVSAREARP